MVEVLRKYAGKAGAVRTQWDSHADGCQGSEAHLQTTLRILLGVLLLTTLLHGLGKDFDEDEFQSMSLGILIAQGKLLYVDVWDNHGPLFSWVLAGLYSLFPWESHWVMLWGRILIFLCLLGTLAVTYRLAREIIPQPIYFPEVACLSLLLSELTAVAAVEVRSDNPMNLLWVSALLLWFRGWNSQRVRDFFWSGLLLGCAFWCSLKALVLGAAVGAMFLAGMVLQRRFLWKPVLAVGLGSVIAPLALLFVLDVQGNLGAFWNSYLLQNADRVRESFFIAFFIVLYWAPVGGSLLYFSLFYAARRVFRREAVPEKILLLLSCSGFLLFQYCFLLPTHHEQSTLPFVVTGALIQAWVLLLLIPHLDVQRYAFIRWLWPERPNLPALVLVLVLSTGALHQWPWVRSVQRIQWADGLLDRIAPGELVFDGIGLPLFRPHPTHYVSWVNALRARLREGSLDVDVPAELDRKDVRYIIRDFRVDSMGSAVDEFIGSHYRPLNYKLLWAAGKVVRQDADLKRQKVDIRVSGRYYWSVAEGGGSLQIDGNPAPNPVELKDGPHSLRWEGEGDLILSVAPPAQWAGM